MSWAKGKGAKKVPPPPVDVPHRCTVLAVDPGETSGWAILRAGRLLSWGHCDVFGTQPTEVILEAIELGLPVVGVFERPFGVRSQSSTGIGTADRIWRHRMQAARERRVVRVYPPTWRARILGRCPETGKAWATAPRDEVRPEEMRVARGLVNGAELHEDEAPAILLGWWGCYAGEVLAKLPKGKTVK